MHVVAGCGEHNTSSLNRYRCRLHLSIGFVILLLSVVSARANLLVNPGFETGGASGATPTGWWKYDWSGQEDWAGRSGTNGMAFWTWGNGWWGGFGQDVPVDLLPGDQVTFSIWGLAETYFQSMNHETWLQVEFWTNGAAAASRTERLDVYSRLVGRLNTWNQYVFTTTNRMPIVKTVKVLVGGGGFTNVASPQSVKWDDAELVCTRPPAGLAVSGGLVSGKVFQVDWSATTSVYYQVWASTKVTGPWQQVRGMALGVDGSQCWRDANAVNAYTSLYYKIVAISVTNSHDQDGDGLSDVIELQRGIDPTRADTDGDGIADPTDPRPASTNEAPVIQAVTLQSDANFHNDAAITMSVQSTDADGDAMQYRYRVGTNSYVAWQSGSTLTWTPQAGETGRRDFRVEVRDPWGLQTASVTTTYLFRAPPHW